MKFSVLTLFPAIVDSFFTTSIMAKAVDRGVVSWNTINIRDWAFDKHHKCDDAPYGGGAGMLMLPEPLGACLQAQGVMPKTQEDPKRSAGTRRVVYLSPSGTRFDQAKARELASCDELVLVCGRYEGIDQRIIDSYVDEELSIGDYVLSSGEVAALVVVDAVYRLVEGVINGESLSEESFSSHWLEYPQYTRPEIYDSVRVPEVLLSGHHERIRRWRLERGIEKTLRNRPDLVERALCSGGLSREEREILQTLQSPHNGSKGEENE